MCGIAGIVLGSNPVDFGSVEVEADAMAARLVHRGPDSDGKWIDPEKRVVLVHRRLSILDLSTAGHQPMISDSSRYALAYNGEIYNHLELREEIGAYDWKGHSDTETLLAGIERWGISRTLSKSRGMFAIALWDREKKELLLARDRFGEKPLYYSLTPERFIFGSELKALKATREFDRSIDPEALDQYLRYSHLPGPYSIYRGTRKLMPGHILRFSLANWSEPIIESYWSLGQLAKESLANPRQTSEEELVEELEALLGDSVCEQSVADVPVGAFLSGGIDSSSVVALLRKRTTGKIKTFTIGFEENKFNEAVYARKVAQHLDTDHTEVYLSSDDARKVVPGLASMFDEPFGDPSAIPTHLVSRLARQQVTVSLSGDGGDELFCGYASYRFATSFAKRLQRYPLWMRKVFSKIVRVCPATVLKWGFEPINWMRGRRPTRPNEYRLRDLAGLVECRDSLEVYFHQADSWSPWRRTNTASNVTANRARDNIERLGCLTNPSRAMMYLDSLGYLPDDILTKVDRAAMLNSLETRIPLLDARIAKYAWSLPDRFNNPARPKVLLRKVLARHVPKDFFERPKKGFAPPIARWLQGPLIDWGDDLLSESYLASGGIFNEKIVRRIWSQHRRGEYDWFEVLWPILMFQNWVTQDSTS